MSHPVVYSVVIPVLNEEASLPELCERLLAVLEGLGEPFEIIFVNDGSTDGTLRWLRDKRRQDPRFGVISFTRNFGQQAASMAGFAHARGEFILTLDADLQNPPEALPKLIESLKSSGADLVTGWRQSRHDSGFRTWPSRAFNALTAWATGAHLHDYGSNLRVYRSHVVKRLADLGEASTHLSALTSWLGYHVVEVPVEHFPRKEGKSRYNFFKLYRATLDMLTSFSVLPIQLISAAGFMTAGLGFLVGLKIIMERILFGLDPSQLQTVVAIIFFFFGLQMFTLGFMGEYLARMFVLLKKHPYYIVKEAHLGTDDGDGKEDNAPQG